MRLKSFHTDIFAGINNIDIEFKEGLNVLAGPNEVGKSSIINAIFVSLFIEPKLRYNYSDLRGKEFSDRFFPYPEGNYVEGRLEFCIGENDYTIYKKWSNNDPEGHIILPDKSRIDKSSIKEKRQDLLPYGKSTYENIVFTKQAEVKSFLNRITNENELTELKGTISNILRKAVLELGDISVDKLGNKIKDELDTLIKRWDLENNRPSNLDRGLNNPYQQGTGKIYDTFIKKEILKRKIKKAEDKELAYQKVSSELEEINVRLKEVRHKKESLTEIEDDIDQREKINRRIGEINNGLKEMRKINNNWPEKEKEINKLSEKIEKLKDKIKILKQEKIRADKLNRKRDIGNKINKIGEIKKSISRWKEKKEKLDNVNKEKVEELEINKQKIDQAEASLKGASLKAKVNRASSDDIFVITGIEGKRKVQIDEEVEANGYINIRTKEIEIEVESAEIDYEEIRNVYIKANKKFQKTLKKLGVVDVSSARDKLQKLRNINHTINNKKERIDDILEEKSYQDLINEKEKYKDIKETRKIKTIDKEIEKAKDKRRDLESEIKIIENKIDEWEESYVNIDSLEKNINELKKEKDSKIEALEKLAELPERFDTSKGYYHTLKRLRKEHDKLNEDFKEKSEKMYIAKSELPKNSTENMKEELQDLKYDFKRLIKRAKSLLKIKNVYNKKLEEIDDKSFNPLIESFSRYINILTDGKYKVSNLDDKFQIELESKDGKKLPADIYKLSYGTSDSAALALRFALFENMFGENNGFVILDDCLVNLDPARREKAIGLIQGFSEKYQVIFSTCDPNTAIDLGGNIINI